MSSSLPALEPRDLDTVVIGAIVIMGCIAYWHGTRCMRSRNLSLQGCSGSWVNVYLYGKGMDKKSRLTTDWDVYGNPR